jgi:hypothetical protein
MPNGGFRSIYRLKMMTVKKTSKVAIILKVMMIFTFLQKRRENRMMRDHQLS